MLFPIIQERNSDHVATSATFLPPLPPLCHLFVTFYFIRKTFRKPAVMRFLRCIFIYATFATSFQGLCGKIKNKKSFLYIQGPSKRGGKGGIYKYVLCKHARYKGLRLVGVFFERWQKGGMKVAEVATCHLLMYAISCVIRKTPPDDVRHQPLTNYLRCVIIKKIRKTPPKVNVINC